MQGLAVTKHVVAYLLIAAIRIPKVLRVCVSKLEPEYLMQPSEMIFAIIWRHLRELYQTYGTLPDKYSLLTFIESRLAQAHYEPRFWEEVQYHVDFLYSDAWKDSVNAELAIQYLQLVINRYFKYKLQSDIQKLNGDDAAFRECLNVLYERFQVQTNFMVPPSAAVIPEDPATLKDEVFGWNCGIGYIDSVIQGHREKEVYVLLGPTGSGKSLLSLQISTQMAKQLDINGDIGWVVFFSYELPYTELIYRAICQSTGISANRLREIIQTGKFDEATDTERLRYNAARNTLNNYLKIFDFSGTGDQPYLGCGGLDEIDNCLSMLEEDTGRPVRLVIIDWAGAAVQRYANAQNKDLARIYTHLLGTFVLESHQKIALKHQTPVWVVHQLAGVVQDKPPHIPMHHSYAAWCKGFAEYAWIAACLGSMDREKNICLLNFSKTRRNRPVLPIKLRLTPTLVFEDVSTKYVIDSRVGFVEVDLDATQ